MSIEMIRIDLRKVWPYYAPFLILILGLATCQEKPLSTEDWGLNCLAFAQGIVVAWRLFHDSGNTEGFIFSRPLSRGRLFVTRWGVGLSLHTLTIISVFLIIGSGLRSSIQNLILSPYHPTVKWYELSVLGSVALFSILSYGIVMFLKLRWNIVSVRSPTWHDILGTAFAALLMLWWYGAMVRSIPKYMTIVYLILAITVRTLASFHCFQHREIET